MQEVPVYKDPTQQCFPERSCNQAGELRSHASGQDFARVLPGPAPPWGPGGAGAHRGDGQGRTSPQAGSRAAGDSWFQPRVQIIRHLCGREVGPRSSHKGSLQARIMVVPGWAQLWWCWRLAPRRHSSDGGLKAWAEMGPMGREVWSLVKLGRASEAISAPTTLRQSVNLAYSAVFKDPGLFL